MAAARIIAMPIAQRNEPVPVVVRKGRSTWNERRWWIPVGAIPVGVAR